MIMPKKKMKKNAAKKNLRRLRDLSPDLQIESLAA